MSPEQRKRASRLDTLMDLLCDVTMKHMRDGNRRRVAILDRRFKAVEDEWVKIIRP